MTGRPEDVIREFIVSVGTAEFDAREGKYAETLGALSALTTERDKAIDEVQFWKEAYNRDVKDVQAERVT